MGLVPIGVKAIVEGLPSFTKAIDAINKRISDTGKKTEESTKSLDPFDKALDKAGVSVDGIKDKIKDMLSQAGPVGDFLSGFVDDLAAIPLPALAAVAAIIFLGKAFLDLGQRGAPLVGLGQAFDNLTASVGVTSQTLLKDLRAASAGTISDFDLIRGANKALVGQVGEFGKAFGEKLPKLLEIARASARATGQ